MARRRFGNTGHGLFWKLNNVTIVIDSMYDIVKHLRSGWSSISLAIAAQELDLPNKLDGDIMMVENSSEYDVMKMLIYSVRDPDLHALVVRTMNSCERLFALAGACGSTMWDAIAGNSGKMVYCDTALFMVSKGYTVNMTNVYRSNERSFVGELVMPPRPGCYKGAVVIDGNSLYGTVLSKLTLTRAPPRNPSPS